MDFTVRHGGHLFVNHSDEDWGLCVPSREANSWSDLLRHYFYKGLNSSCSELSNIWVIFVQPHLNHFGI